MVIVKNRPCTLRFIAALFTIARTWKQPRYPLADEWIKKLWFHIHNGILLSHKRDTFEFVLMRWMKLEPITLNEANQKEKHQYSILKHIYGIYKDGNDDSICETAKKTLI